MKRLLSFFLFPLLISCSQFTSAQAGNTNMLLFGSASGNASFVDDFISSQAPVTLSAPAAYLGDTEWDVGPVTGGTTGTLTPTNGTFQNPGQILITTPATSGDGAYMFKTNLASAAALGVLGASSGWQLDFWIQTPATITNYGFKAGVVKVGFGNESSDSLLTGANVIEYDTANASASTDWTFLTVSAGNTNYSASSVVPAASTWYHFRISSTTAGTISFQIGAANGALGAATNITTDVDTTSVMTPFIQLYPRSAAAVTVTIDRISYFATTGRL